MARKQSKGRRALEAAAFRWEQYFAHRHGRFAPLSEDDTATLRDLVEVQAGGVMVRALEIVEAIVDAPVPGNSLSVRRAHFWHWQDQGEPRRYTTPPARRMRAIREAVAQNAGAA